MRLLDDIRDRQRRRTDRVATILLAALVAGFGLVLARVAQVQLAPMPQLAEHISQRTSTRPHDAPRGDLRDRRGRLLAATRSGYRLFVDPAVLAERVDPPLFAPSDPEATRQARDRRVQENLTTTINTLADITGVDRAEVAQRIIGKLAQSRERERVGKGPIRYVSIGSVLDDGQLARARELDLRWVGLERRAVREQTSSEAVASIVGKVGVDHNGLLGIESALDALLQGADGSTTYVRDARGRAMWIDAGAYRPPERGRDVRLSLDLVLQQIAIDELARGVADADAAAGRLVLADPATGEILAMVDHRRMIEGLVEPGSEQERRAIADGRWIRCRTLTFDPERRLHPALERNRCVEDVYEPGSTFKSFVWSAVIERGAATIDEMFNTHKGVWKTEYGRTLRDVDPMDELSWADVLVYSSNIGMAQGAHRLTHEQLREAVTRFGFGGRTNIGLPGETRGLVTSPERWSKYTQTSVAMGYEVGVTPVQMVRAFSVFARSDGLAGTLPELTLLATSERFAQSVRRRVLPEGVALRARHVLSKVAENMLRRMQRRFPDEALIDVGMFGKSGTAKIARPDGRGYFEQYNSSFVAGAPLDRPRLVILVVIDDPGPKKIRARRHYGSWVAGPVAARVLKRSLDYLGVTTQTREPPAELALPGPTPAPLASIPDGATVTD